MKVKCLCGEEFILEKSYAELAFYGFFEIVKCGKCGQSNNDALKEKLYHKFVNGMVAVVVKTIEEYNDFLRYSKSMFGVRNVSPNAFEGDFVNFIYTKNNYIGNFEKQAIDEYYSDRAVAYIPYNLFAKIMEL